MLQPFCGTQSPLPMNLQKRPIHKPGYQKQHTLCPRQSCGGVPENTIGFTELCRGQVGCGTVLAACVVLCLYDHTGFDRPRKRFWYRKAVEYHWNMGTTGCDPFIESHMS